MKLFPTSETLARYKNMVKLFVKYGLSDLVLKAGLRDVLMDEDMDEEARDPKAEELPRDLERLGPTFIKFGQFLCTFSDILPTQFQEALTRLQDRVEPFGFEEAEKIFEASLGIKIADAFREFEREPLSAASIGQVHRAWLKDGEPAAVKIQRPGIQSMIFSDLELIRYLAELLDHHTELGRRARFENMADEFRKTILRELDFRLEAQNLKILGRNLADFDRILVPKPFEELTGGRVLTMQFVEGGKLGKGDLTNGTPPGNVELAEELFKAYLKQTLVDGFFHADPHPGNILLTPGGKLALLDLGMVAYLSGELRDSLLIILTGISEGDGDKVVPEALKISEKTGEFNPQNFTRQINDLVAYQQHRSARDFNMGKIVLEVSKISRKSGVIIPIELTILGKTLLNLDEVGRRLAPEFNPNECIRRNASDILQHRIWKSLSPGNLVTTFMETRELIAKMPHRANRILEALANNRIKVKVDTIDEQLLISGFQKVANRIAMGLVLAALIVGAALMMNVQTSYTLFGYPALAIVLFLAAAMGGVYLLFKIVFIDRGL